MKIISAMLASVLLLSACGGGSSDTDAAGNQSTDSPVQPATADPAPGSPDTVGSDPVDNSATDSVDNDSSAENNTDNNTPGDTETTLPYVAKATDPIWRVCDADIGTGSRNSWQRQQIQSGDYRDCIKACPTDNSFIPDPAFPGLGWNDTLSTACAVVSADEDTGPHYAVPLYLPDQQPTRQVFTNISAFQLHAEGGQWQCAHQQRRLSSEPFLDTGVEISYQFFADGTVSVQNNNTRETIIGNWWFDGYTETRVAGLPTNSPDSTDINALPQRYIGNIKVADNNMQIYRTTVDRLSCTSQRAADSLNGYPESPDQLSAVQILSSDEVIGRSMSCQVYESLSLSLDGQFFTGIGYYSNVESINPPVFVNISQSADIDASGLTRYQFQNDSTTSYTVSNEGVFDSTFRNPGDVTRSFAYHLIDFKPYNNHVIMTDRYAVGGSGSSSIYITYSICSDLQ